MKSWIIEYTTYLLDNQALPETRKETIGPFVDKRAAWAWGCHWLGQDNEDWSIKLSPVRADSLPSQVESHIRLRD